MAKSKGKRALCSRSSSHSLQPQCSGEKQLDQKHINRGGACASGIMKDPDKSRPRARNTRRSRSCVWQFSETIYEICKYYLEYKYEHQTNHLAEDDRSINQFNNTGINSTSLKSSLNTQNFAWKSDESCPRKFDYKQRLEIGIAGAHALRGLHGGAPGPPLTHNFYPVHTERATTDACIIEHYTIDDSPTIGSRLRGHSTSVLQEDSHPSESLIALNVMRYATATNEAEHRDEEQLTHQLHTSSPRPLEKHSDPEESAAPNQVAHVELLKPTPAAPHALKSVKSGEDYKDSEEVDVNSEEGMEDSRGPRLHWGIGSATRHCASFNKTLRRRVSQMRFFLQFGIGLRTHTVNYSELRPIQFFGWLPTRNRYIMGLLACAALVNDDCLPLTVHLERIQEAPTHAVPSTSNARSARPSVIYLPEDPFAYVGDGEVEIVQVQAQTEAEEEELQIQGISVTELVAGLGSLNPEASDGQYEGALAAVGVAIGSQVSLVNAGVSYCSAPAPAVLVVTRAESAIEEGVFGSNQYMEQTDFHQVGIGNGMEMGWLGIAGIESSDSNFLNAQVTHMNMFQQGINGIIIEARAAEDYLTGGPNDGGLHSQTIVMQGRLTLQLISNPINENSFGAHSFEGTGNVDEEWAVRDSDISLSHLSPPEPP